MIANDEEYRAALHRIWQLIDALPGTPEGRELDLLADDVDKYEFSAFWLDCV